MPLLLVSISVPWSVCSITCYVGLLEYLLRVLGITTGRSWVMSCGPSLRLPVSTSETDWGISYQGLIVPICARTLVALPSLQFTLPHGSGQHKHSHSH